ncbi:hypothetical protein EDC01DRAFT_728496 [Geopyxis carbonaria]|nr:hypothetical protein EDC01DRAFT_728496 [Geopyxis carbonaria]
MDSDSQLKPSLKKLIEVVVTCKELTPTTETLPDPEGPLKTPIPNADPLPEKTVQAPVFKPQPNIDHLSGKIDRAPFFKLVWQPDVSMMTASQIHDHISERPSGDTAFKSILELLVHKNPGMRVLNLSKEFGKEVAELVVGPGWYKRVKKHATFDQEEDPYPKYDLGVVDFTDLHSLEVLRAVMKHGAWVLILHTDEICREVRADILQGDFSLFYNVRKEIPGKVQDPEDVECHLSAICDSREPAPKLTIGPKKPDVVLEKIVLVIRNKAQLILYDSLSQMSCITTTVILDELSPDTCTGATVLFLADYDGLLLLNSTRTELDCLNLILKGARNILWIQNVSEESCKPEFWQSPAFCQNIRTEYPELKLVTLQLSQDNHDSTQIVESVLGWCLQPEFNERDIHENRSILYVERLVPDEDLNSEFLKVPKRFTNKQFSSVKPLKLHADEGPAFFSDMKSTEVLADGKRQAHIFGAAGLVTNIGNNDLAVLPVPFCTALCALMALGELNSEPTPGIGFYCPETCEFAAKSVLIRKAASSADLLAAIQIVQSHKCKLVVTVENEEDRVFLHKTFKIPLSHIIDHPPQEANVQRGKDDTAPHIAYREKIFKLVGTSLFNMVLGVGDGEWIRPCEYMDVLGPTGTLISIEKNEVRTKMHTLWFDKHGSGIVFGKSMRARGRCSMSSIMSHPKIGCMLLDHMMDLYNKGRISDAVVRDNHTHVHITDLESNNEHGEILISFTENYGKTIRYLEPTFLPADKTYLLVDCLVGMGHHLTLELLSLGARSFVFLSGSDASSPVAKDLLAQLHAAGAVTHVISGSGSSRRDIDRAVLAAPSPIAGVVTNAVVWNEKLSNPEIDSTRHLRYAATATGNVLDFFIMVLNTTSIIGLPKFSVYSSANNFMDGFAHVNSRTKAIEYTTIAVPASVEGNDNKRNYMEAGLDETDKQELVGALRTAVSKADTQKRIITGFDVRRILEQAHELGLQEFSPVWAQDVKFGVILNALEAACKLR